MTPWQTWTGRPVLCKPSLTAHKHSSDRSAMLVATTFDIYKTSVIQQDVLCESAVLQGSLQHANSSAGLCSCCSISTNVFHLPSLINTAQLRIAQHSTAQHGLALQFEHSRHSDSVSGRAGDRGIRSAGSSLEGTSCNSLRAARRSPAQSPGHLYTSRVQS